MRYMRIVLVLYLLALAIPPVARATGDPPRVQVTQVDNSKYPDVTVYVSVTDAAGQAITGLKQGEFSLTEDSVPVRIVDFRGGGQIAISTVLVIDVSSSMEGEKINGAKQAALTFVDLMRSQDQAALVAFNENVLVVQRFTTDHPTLKRAITDLRVYGNTAWRDALYQAADMLRTISGRKSVILLTDGMDNSSRKSLDQAIAFGRQGEVPVYAIGLGGRPSLPFLGGGLDESSLTRVAQQTEGKYYYTPSAAELKALYESLASGMQQEYAVIYRSPRPTFDGTRRNIVVTVAGAAGSGVYLEKHLLNIRSDPLVGGACLLPLLLALTVPVGIGRLRRRHVPPTSRSKPGVWVEAASLCSQCGAPVRSGAKFCSKCGAVQHTDVPSSPVPICPRCGNTLRPGARFCNRCGIQPR